MTHTSSAAVGSRRGTLIKIFVTRRGLIAPASDQMFQRAQSIDRRPAGRIPPRGWEGCQTVASPGSNSKRSSGKVSHHGVLINKYNIIYYNPVLPDEPES